LSGTVTFLFTDIEGSTELLKRLGRDEYDGVLAQHARILRAAVASAGGRVVDTQGDALFCVFPTAREAVLASIEAQRGLTGHDWPDGVSVRVRMGVHSGEPKTGEQGYVGIGVHRAARIGAAAHGGQVLLSDTARALAADDLPAGVSLRDLGAHRLKDIDEPVRLYQVVAAGLQERFPAPRTADRGRGRRTRVMLVAVGVVIAAGVAAAVLLTTGSASAKPVKLEANSLAVLDPRTGRPVGDVPLGFAPTNVVAGGDDIWVLNGDARTAVAIDPKRLRVAQTIGTDGDADSQYATGANEWVAIPGGVDELNSDGKEDVTLWPPSRGTSVLNAGSGEACQPSVTGDGKTVWVAEGRHFAAIDAASGNVLRKLTLPDVTGLRPGSVCYGLIGSSQGLLATRSADLSFGQLDPRSASYTPLVSNIGLNVAGSDVSGNITGTAGFGSLWLSGSSQNIKTLKTVGVLSQLDLVSGQTTSQTQLPTIGEVASDPTTGIWALEPATEAIAQVDPNTGQIQRTISLHHFAYAVSAGHGRIWVGLTSP
jgi:class 3 adenylate cyclase